MVELIKKELAGDTTIRRAVRQGQPNVKALQDQPTATDSGPFHPYTSLSYPYSGPSHPSSPSCSYCKYKVYKDRQDKLLEKLEVITEAVEELKSKRGVISSEKGPLKKVDIYVALGGKERKELRKTTHAKKKKSVQKYTMHMFDTQDFKMITNMHEWYVDKYIDEILCLMRGRKLVYPDAYHVVDMIMDLNYYNNFKNRYNELTGPAKTPSRSGFDWTTVGVVTQLFEAE
ncbi:hypothetical protein P3L10_030885 [Capsicum annuum]